MLVFLSTAVGTVVGVGVAMVLMSRRNKPAIVGDPALRQQLQNTEWALAAAGKDVEEMRKQLAERQGVRDELERAQQQLAAMLADKEKQTAQRVAAEQRVAEMSDELTAARERALAGEESMRRVAELEVLLVAEHERAGVAGDAEQRVVELQALLAATEERVVSARQQETALGESERRAVELQASLAAAEDRAVKAEGAIEAAEARIVECVRESASLREQLAALSAQATTAGAAAARVATLEAEIEALQAQAQRASSTIEELEGMLRKERQSSVEAMELLSAAQDKFSGRFAAAER